MISSAANAHIQRVLRLRTRRQRDAKGRLIVQGARALQAAADRGALKELYLTEAGARRRGSLTDAASAAGVEVRLVSEGVMQAIASTTSTPDAAGIAACSFGGPEVSKAGGPAAILRGVRDPGAAGALLATAAAFGVRSVLQGAATVDLGDPRVVRAAAGAHFTVSLGRSQDDEAVLVSHGDAVVSLHPAGTAIWEAALPDAMMLVVQDPADAVAAGALVGAPAALPLTQQAALVWYEWARGR